MSGHEVLQHEVQRVLRYDQATGSFTWQVTLSNRAKAGRPAGVVKKVNRNMRRVIISIHGKAYKAHNLAWIYVRGSIPHGFVVDHINGNPLDNSISNLRLATPSQNQMNRSLQSNNTSGTTGVTWNAQAKKWQAQIKKNGVVRRIGLFSAKGDAIKARKQVEQVMFGEFMRQR